MSSAADAVVVLPVCDGGKPDSQALLAVYAEVCRSYHAIDDFRTKLLGILPIASLVGILLLDKDSLFAGESPMRRMVGFGSFFAAAFTLALFLFEIRGLIRSDYLIKRGKSLEELLGVEGQFFVCARQQATSRNSVAERVFNTKTAASAIYSLVFAAWFFMALKFSFGLSIVGCGLTATLIGIGLGAATNVLLSRHIAA